MRSRLIALSAVSFASAAPAAAGGYYHDGRFAILRDVIKHYNAHFNLALTDAEIADLAEYLKSH
jgi:hypothetical protein